MSSFFMGKLYPIIFAIIISVGHLSELEIYSAAVCIFLAALAFLTCRSIRPMLITIPAFIFQVTRAHSPATPDFSDYYFTEWRLYIVIILGIIAVLSIVFFIAKNKLYRKLSFTKTRLLIPLLILSVAFLTNGLGAESWTPAALAFGAGQILIYLILFLLFYLGFSEEDTKEALVDYFCYVTLIIAYMILVQMAALFISGTVLSETGAIIKTEIHLGWATCNPLGAILVSLIPMLFYGAMTKRMGWFYFITAVLVYIAAVSTCSRNALLFGTITFVACLLVACFKSSGKKRVVFVAVSVLGLALVATATIIYIDKIRVIFESFVNQGIDNNGRFNLWGGAWKHFSENTVFGSGFFSLNDTEVYESIAIMPTAAHNTILEFLYATGGFGLVAYVYYRAETVRVFLEHPSPLKTMLALATFTVVAESLLDVFVFSFYPMLYPMAALAIACHINDVSDRDKLALPCA